MRNPPRALSILARLFAMVACAGGALSAPGCKTGERKPGEVAPHEAQSPPILQFAAEAVPGQDEGAADYPRDDGGGVVRLQPPRAFVLKDVHATTDALGYPALGFELADSEQEEFHRWTAELVHHGLAILVDGRVITVPRVNTPLPGRGTVESGGQHWTEDQVRELVARIRGQIAKSKKT